MKKRKKKLNQETIAQTIYQLSKLFMDPFTRSINLVDLSRRIYIYTHSGAKPNPTPIHTALFVQAGILFCRYRGHRGTVHTVISKG